MDGVYISCADEDQEVAQSIGDALNAAGIPCATVTPARAEPIATAPGDPVTSTGSPVTMALAQSRIFILVYSAHANHSTRVRHEAQYAVESSLILIPFRIEDVPLSGAMEYFISTTHWLDAITTSRESALALLTTTVQRVLASTPRGETAPAAEPRRRAASRGMAVSKEEEALLQGLEGHLARFLGPIAPTLVRETAQNAPNPAMLIERLAEHLPSKPERQKFLQAGEAILAAHQAAVTGWQGAQSVAAAAESSVGKETPAAPQEPAAPRDSATAAFGEEVLRTATRQLTPYIGPLARVLVQRTAARCTSRDELYRRLAEYIPSSAERTLFIRSAGK